MTLVEQSVGSSPVISGANLELGSKRGKAPLDLIEMEDPDLVCLEFADLRARDAATYRRLTRGAIRKS
jgi:hypothetical protein